MLLFICLLCLIMNFYRNLIHFSHKCCSSRHYKTSKIFFEVLGVLLYIQGTTGKLEENRPASTKLGNNEAWEQ